MPPQAKKSATTKKAPPASKADGKDAKAAKPNKKSFDVKLSASNKKVGPKQKAESTVLNATLIGESGNGSMQGILFYLKRVDGEQLPCWADEILADQARLAEMDSSHVPERSV